MLQTDGIHARDNLRPGSNTPEMLSEAVKMLKGDYVIRAIDKHKMDKALIFCRTKVDCDNLESYLMQVGGKCKATDVLIILFVGDYILVCRIALCTNCCLIRCSLYLAVGTKGKSALNKALVTCFCCNISGKLPYNHYD